MALTFPCITSFTFRVYRNIERVIVEHLLDVYRKVAEVGGGLEHCIHRYSYIRMN